MTFKELQAGDYFRITGMSIGYVYRKTSDDCCSLNATSQPIRSHTQVKKLTGAELIEYLAQQPTAAEQNPKPVVRLKSRYQS
ncbi:hypothetical protein NIES4072_70080 [Nostoc commune NIES-4072]|uniref:Uncharacterized protein n=1 Tax=Nostoc commune NIES-4072 TaxID=2005467 RepID=A0A2R5FX03_NOSCO|nr:hypothetical protein [Nostoc commune]BBD70641.1 hypothetical protein NIES4070_70520 [Nostoc commune HK-02]GBG23296.1 hypothetical protein NIES4072_70080 [Nostoc commune NIES-4072]